MTMNNETPPIDLAHLKALYDSIEQKVISKDIDFHVSSEEGDRITDFWVTLHNAFPQLCRELEAERQRNGPVGHAKAEMRKAEESLRLATMRADSLQSQLSKAEGERDRMRAVLPGVSKELRAMEGRESLVRIRTLLGAAADQVDAIAELYPELSSQPIPQAEGREVVKPTVTQEEYLLQLFTNWCECSPYGEQIPDKWPELMADFVKKHKGKDRDAMAELFAEGDPGEPFEKLLESIFVTSCQFVLSDLSQAVDDGDTTKLAIIGFPAPVSEKGPVDSPEGLRPHIEK
jgi:hypothetical protein